MILGMPYATYRMVMLRTPLAVREVHLHKSSVIFEQELTVSVCFNERIATSNLHFICIILASRSCMLAFRQKNCSILMNKTY